MASSSLFFFVAIAVALLISPVRSLTCTSQTFSQHFTNCTDLPTLNASLHWTYDPTARPNPTLDIAFIAPPARPEGWIGWALNPTGQGMLGAQSLIAFRDGNNGSMVVKTYDLSSYGSIAESRISYEVLSKRGEYSDGVMRIFATLAMPSSGGGGDEVNQVWQVGASVTNGVPERHNMLPENFNSKSTLRLVGTAAENRNVTITAPASGSGGNHTGGSGKAAWGSGLGLGGILVMLGVLIWGF